MQWGITAMQKPCRIKSWFCQCWWVFAKQQNWDISKGVQRTSENLVCRRWYLFGCGALWLLPFHKCRAKSRFSLGGCGWWNPEMKLCRPPPQSTNKIFLSPAHGILYTTQHPWLLMRSLDGAEPKTVPSSLQWWLRGEWGWREVREADKWFWI